MNDKDLYTVSVVIPVYNECSTIETLLGLVQAQDMVTEIIIIDDCSTDGTVDLLKNMEGCHRCRMLYHERNRGKGAALRTGFAAAKGDVVIIQDADLE